MSYRETYQQDCTPVPGHVLGYHGGFMLPRAAVILPLLWFCACKPAEESRTKAIFGGGHTQSQASKQAKSTQGTGNHPKLAEPSLA